MTSITKQIGIIGEQIFVTEFLKYGIQVSIPVGDNAPYDLIVEINNKLLKVQIKTTEFVKNGIMIFRTNVTNPFRKTNRRYTKEEIDLFGLYCIENNYIGLMLFEECTSKDTKIRITPTKNNQHNNVKLANDFLFSNKIQQLK